MKSSYIFLINVYILIYVNYFLVINNFMVLAHQLKYNFGLYFSFNLKGDIFINLYFNMACAKSIAGNNSN